MPKREAEFMFQFLQQVHHQRLWNEQSAVLHVCNPSYLGDWEDLSLPSLGKQAWHGIAILFISFIGISYMLRVIFSSSNSKYLKCVSFVWFLVFILILEFELRAFCMLGKSSST
jgi:hypothetical protein